jgi:hypothetical protein
VAIYADNADNHENVTKGSEDSAGKQIVSSVQYFEQGGIE